MINKGDFWRLFLWKMIIIFIKIIRVEMFLYKWDHLRIILLGVLEIFF